MRYIAGAALALRIVNVLAQEDVTVVTVSINTGTCTPASGVASGTTLSPSSTVIPDGGSDVGTPFGVYSFDGVYPPPATGNLLNGAVTTSDLMTIEYCAEFCQGSQFYALSLGDTCNCGTAPPTTDSVVKRDLRKTKRQAPPVIPCAGDADEACGGYPDYANVFELATDESEATSVVVVSGTNSAGVVTFATQTSYIPLTTPSGSSAAVPVTSAVSIPISVSSTSVVVSVPPTTVSTSVAVIVTTPSGSTAAVTHTTSVPVVSSPSHSTALVSSTPGVSTTPAAPGTTSPAGSVTPPGSTTPVASITPATTSAGTTGPAATGDQYVPQCTGAVSYAAGTHTDFFGITYTVECNSGIAGNISDRYAHADTFQDCLQVCSLLDGCTGITYDTNTTLPGNCAPFDSGNTFAYPQVNIVAAVPVSGPIAQGVLADAQLCPASNQSAYTDQFGNTYNIGCDQNTDGGVGNFNLYDTIQETLEDCLNYCGMYEGCIGAVWSGPYQNGQYPSGDGTLGNCFPFSSAGTVQYYGGNQYGLLQS
ncbi:hypothetical protein MMC21_000699 [Puttea exsequens]|nr:hypothetical protein [Puttea exsequens]